MLNQQLIIGSTYRVRFKSGFERHGYCTTPGVECLHKGGGVFRLEQIASFRDIVMAGIKLYDNFFAPLGISEEDYRKYFNGKPEDEYAKEYTTTDVVNYKTSIVQDLQDGVSVGKKQVTAIGRKQIIETGKSVMVRHADDLINYAHHPIYKFVDIKDPMDAIYAPELTIDGFPEVDINEYKDLNLVIHLGYYDHPEILDPLLVSIRDRLAVYGVRADSIKLYSTGKEWLTVEEYEALKKIRKPAYLKVIEEEDWPEILGEDALIGGEIKKIVRVVDPDLVSEQVAIESLTTKYNAKIDNRLMLVEVEPGEVWDGWSTLYQMTAQNNGVDQPIFRIAEAEDMVFAPGQEIISLKVSTDTTRQGNKPYYIKNLTDSYSLVDPADVVSTEGHPVYYVCEGTGVGDTEEEAAAAIVYSYRVVTDQELAAYIAVRDGSTPTLVPGQQVPLAIYERNVSEEYQKTLDALDVTSVGHPTYYEPTIRWFKETPVTEDTLKLIGRTLDYKDEFEQTKSVELQLVDIVDFASHTKPIDIPGLAVAPDAQSDPVLRAITWKQSEYDGLTTDSQRNDYLAFHNKQLEADKKYYEKYYAGRKFRWQDTITVTSGGKTVTETGWLETILPDTLTAQFAGKTGILCGVVGKLSKATLILDKDQVVRNYYIQYRLCNQQMEADRREALAMQLAAAKINSDRLDAQEAAAAAQTLAEAAVNEKNEAVRQRDELSTSLTTSQGDLAAAHVTIQEQHDQIAEMAAILESEGYSTDSEGHWVRTT